MRVLQSISFVDLKSNLVADDTAVQCTGCPVDDLCNGEEQLHGDRNRLPLHCIDCGLSMFFNVSRYSL